jgi:hypothetical protein
MTSRLDDLIIRGGGAGVASPGCGDLLPYWQMNASERAVLLAVLRELSPSAAIEIGTAQGGSLAVIAAHARHVYSLDIDPRCEQQLASRFTNVSFRSGPSHASIPGVLEEIEREGRSLELVLIDGDHSREGVTRDIELILQYRPRVPMVVLLHDSFNPFCRYGMRDARWAASPYVHDVELDFVPGIVLGRPGAPPEMWGGLGAALLTPEPRDGTLVVRERNRALFEEMVPRSAHASYFGSGAPSLGGGLYRLFASVEDGTLREMLQEGAAPADGDAAAGFLGVRRRLAPQLTDWQSQRRRLAIYGGGEHTRALLGLVPELFPLVTCFIDRRGGGELLGRPCLDPGSFTPDMADIVVYSSRAFEAEMHAGFAHHPIEHVRLYS